MHICTESALPQCTEARLFTLCVSYFRGPKYEQIGSATMRLQDVSNGISTYDLTSFASHSVHTGKLSGELFRAPYPNLPRNFLNTPPKWSPKLFIDCPTFNPVMV